MLDRMWDRHWMTSDDEVIIWSNNKMEPAKITQTPKHYVLLGFAHPQTASEYALFTISQQVV